MWVTSSPLLGKTEWYIPADHSSYSCVSYIQTCGSGICLCFQVMGLCLRPDLFAIKLHPEGETLFKLDKMLSYVSQPDLFFYNTSWTSWRSCWTPKMNVLISEVSLLFLFVFFDDLYNLQSTSVCSYLKTYIQRSVVWRVLSMLEKMQAALN